MKTTANNLLRIDTMGEKNKDLSFDKDELLFKMPAVVLLVVLPGVLGHPMQLYYANRALALHTHHDPEVLKEPGCDFFSRLLFAEDRCLIEKTVDHLLRNPEKEVEGLVFRINTVEGELLWVICSCRLLSLNGNEPTHIYSVWQVYNKKSFPREAMRNCVKALDRMDNQKKLDELSVRETDVLTCLGKGLTLQETADILFISYKTVEIHVSHIKDKLDLHCNNALAAFAIRMGLC